MPSKSVSTTASGPHPKRSSSSISSSADWQFRRLRRAEADTWTMSMRIDKEKNRKKGLPEDQDLYVNAIQDNKDTGSVNSTCSIQPSPPSTNLTKRTQFLVGPGVLPRRRPSSPRPRKRPKRTQSLVGPGLLPRRRPSSPRPRKRPKRTQSLVGPGLLPRRRASARRNPAPNPSPHPRNLTKRTQFPNHQTAKLRPIPSFQPLSTTRPQSLAPATATTTASVFPSAPTAPDPRRPDEFSMTRSTGFGRGTMAILYERHS